MFDANILLKALPSIWSDKFTDKDILKALYSFTGEYIAEAYQGGLERVSSGSLTSTPLFRYKSWQLLPLYEIHRLAITAEEDTGTSIVIYGLREEDALLDSCARIYYSPDLSGDYLSLNSDYEFFDADSKHILDLAKLSGNTSFFSRFNRFIVFYSVDPIYDLGIAEPSTELATYPLVYRITGYDVDSVSLPNLLGSSVTLNSSGTNTTAQVLDIQQVDEDVYVYLDPGAFTQDLYGTVLIEGIQEDPLVAQLASEYTLEMHDVNLWAYRVRSDELSLFKKWGHLATEFNNYSRPIRSSESYRELLQLLLESRMLGLTTRRISNIAAILSGSESLAFSSLSDTLKYLDLQSGVLFTELTRYSLLPKSLINYRVLENCPTIKISNSTIDSQDCSFIKILDSATYRALLPRVWGSLPKLLAITNLEGNPRADIVWGSSDQRLLARRNAGVAMLPSSGIRIYYSNSEYIRLLPGSYEIIELANDDRLPLNTILNPTIEVLDYDSGLLDEVGKGLYIPKSIWDADTVHRREVVFARSPFIVGSMPRHRIGDYELAIPTDDLNSTRFDRPTEANPEGHAWATSYKLLKDLLQTKVALIKPLDASKPRSLSSVLSTVSEVRDLSKALLTSQSVDLVEFIPAAMSTLEVSVDIPIQEHLFALSSQGIGSLGMTLLFSGSFNLQEGDSLDSLVLTPPQQEPFLGLPSVEVSVNLLGSSDGYILLSVGIDPRDVYVLLNSGYSTQLKINNSLISASLQVDTNYVGSSSELMVVGAAYPEYTSYYDFPDNTLSDWLQIST